MTTREAEILQILTENPLISQETLAKRLGITRSSVAVHIANLMRKGKILGKGYIMGQEQNVLVIGGANFDIQGFPHGTFRLHDSNPGTLKASPGGVGRNIADNLSRLGVATKLISAVGDDIYGQRLLKEAAATHLDVRDCLICSDANTATYLSLLDEHGEMVAALSDMAITERLTIDFFKKKDTIIRESSYLVVDTNLSSEVLDYLSALYHKDIPMIVDTVSVAKAERVKEIIGRFHTVKPNKYEAELLTGITITTKSDAERAGKILLDKGVKQVFLSLGVEGLYYSNDDQFGWLKPHHVKVSNATGAGDAFVAALTYGNVEKMPIAEIATFAQAAAAMAVMSEDTINPTFSVENVKKILEEF